MDRRVEPAVAAGEPGIRLRIGDLSIGVAPTAGLPASGTVTGTIFVSLTGSLNALPPIAVTLTLMPASTNLGPFGTVDTPTDNRTGVTGAVPFTGWALDDVGVHACPICRAAFGAEIAPLDPNCGGAAEIFVGYAVFIDGARPDVAAAFPTYPLSTRAGWGFMVLTNMLPNQGNGAYRIHDARPGSRGHWFAARHADDDVRERERDAAVRHPRHAVARRDGVGHQLYQLRLGADAAAEDDSDRRIDDSRDDRRRRRRPRRLQPRRSDIQALFPGLNNTNGAVGFRILDTTLMANGLHTISWAVTDNAGAIEGIGSRFFTVSNGIASA